jgi:hypothetical protein
MMQGKISPLLLEWTLFCGFAFAAEPPPVLWEKDVEVWIPEYVLETLDGGFVVAGWTETDDGTAGLLVKTDPAGNLVWTRTFSEQPVEVIVSVLQRSDGDYVLGGFGGDWNIPQCYLTLRRTDLVGNTIWRKTFGVGLESGGKVLQTADGGYVLSGIWNYWLDTGQDAYLVRTDDSGKLIWDTHFGSTGDEYADSVAASPDGGFVVAGQSYLLFDSDIYLAKVNGKGDLLWEKSVGTLDQDWGAAIISNAQGNLVVAGTRICLGTRRDVCLLEYDPDGRLVREGGLKDRSITEASCVRQTREASYIVTGFSAPEPVAPWEALEVLLAAFDKDGAPSWAVSLGPGVGWGVQQTMDGGFIVLVETVNGTRLVKVGGKPPTFNFRRGRMNADGVLDLADAVALLRILFAGKGTIGCEDAADANDDGKVNVSDAIAILGHLFGGKGLLPAPFSECGPDPTEDGLTCATFEGCK